MKIEAITPPEDGLGESGHWDPRTNTLLWIDFPNKKLKRLSASTGEIKTFDLAQNITFAVPCSNGQATVISQKTQIDFLDERTGAQTTFVSAERLNLGDEMVMNDGKCDQRGRLWFGSWKGSAPMNEVPPVGGIYSITANGVIKQHAQGFKLPNGLDWTTDNKTMYYADTAWNCVFAFDFDLETGSLSRQRKALDFSTTSQTGGPDGLTVDANDNLWVAFIMGGRVVQYDMKSGEEIRRIDLSPVTLTTCPNFGGTRFDELFITTARSMLKDEQKAQQPQAGSVFKVTELGVKGKPPYLFAGQSGSTSKK